MTRKNAYFLLLIAIASISLSPILTRFSSAPSLSISAFRLLFATILTYIMAKGPIKKGLYSLTPSVLFWSMLSGITLALHFWSWIESLRFTSIASSTLLVCTHPLIVLPLSVLFFKEPLTLKKVLGLILTLSGTFFLSGIANIASLAQSLYGNLLAVIGAVFVGVYLLIGKKIRPTLNNETYTFLVYAVATLFLFVAQFLYKIDMRTFSSQDYFIFILLAIFPTLLGHTLFNKCLEVLTATTVSLATLGEPVLASLYALILFNEEVTKFQLIAGALIIIGIMISELPTRRQIS